MHVDTHTVLMGIAAAFALPLVVIVCGLFLAVWIGKAARMKGFSPPSTGIEILEGKPGSGKSLHAVKRVVTGIKVDRRPVYTNLPLKMRVIRKLLNLTGGEALAKYIKPLSREHFEKFIERLAQYSAYRDERQKLDANFRGSISDAQVDREFEEVHGPHVIDGPESNWIPIGAFVVVDEAHKWFDQRFQKTEHPGLLALTTMHRHLLQQYLLLSQDRMQIALSWRRQCVEYTKAVDKRRRPFMFGLRIPLPLFFYEVWAFDAEEGRPGAKPLRTFTEAPFMDKGLTWRLYNSFTHVGSVRKLRKAMEKTRASVEGRKVEKVAEMAKRGSFSGRLFKYGAVAALLGFAWYMGTQRGGSAVAQTTAVSIEREREERKIGAASAAAASPTSRPWIKATEDAPGMKAAVKEKPRVKDDGPRRIGVVAPAFVVIEGRVIGIGERYGSLKLSACSVKSGSSVWEDVDTGEQVTWGCGGTAVRAGLLDGGRPSSRPTETVGDVLRAADAARAEAAARASTRPAGNQADGSVDAAGGAYLGGGRRLVK
jgi:hypothetical protein